MFFNFKQFGGLNFRVKIILAICLALLLSFSITFFDRPKNNNIPVLPRSLYIELHQQSNGDLDLKSIKIVNEYSPDHQSNFQTNYYSIYLKSGEKILFTGKTLKSHTLFTENFHTASVESTLVEELLGDFKLYLPYYEDATELIMVDDKGNRALFVDLKKQNLQIPEMQRKTCGDGICADDENIISCYKDCSDMMGK